MSVCNVIMKRESVVSECVCVYTVYECVMKISCLSRPVQLGRPEGTSWIF